MSTKNKPTFYYQKDLYDKAGYDAPWYKNNINSFKGQILPQIKKYCDKSSKVLDIGCGNGRFAAIFADHVHSVDAVDPGRDSLPDAHKRDNLTFIKSTWDNFESSEKYNIIYLHGVLFLFERANIKNIFNKLKSYLQNDGVIVVVDNVSRDISEEIKKKCKGCSLKTRLEYYEGCVEPIPDVPLSRYYLEGFAEDADLFVVESFIQSNGLHRISVLAHIK